MKSHRVNTQAVIEAACFILFGAAMLYLLYSEKYLSYVTPRMKPYLYFTIIVMGVWAAVSMKGLFQIVYRKRTGRYFILLIPIMLLFLPHKEMRISNLSGSTGLLTGSAISTTSELKEAAPSDMAPAEETELVEPALPGKAVPEQRSKGTDVYMSLDIYGEPLPLHGYDEVNRTITVSNDEFYEWLIAIFENLDTFEGYQITMTGSVYRDPAVFTQNEFVPARLLMSCCVADLTPCGIICVYDEIDDWKADSWVTVTGTLHKGQYQGQDEPQIHVLSIVPAEPVEGYIFPYG